MEIADVESGEALDVLRAFNGQGAALKSDQSTPSQVLEHPVGVNDRQARGVGTVYLPDRKRRRGAGPDRSDFVAPKLIVRSGREWAFALGR
jgi:hypothetical protein